MLASNSPFPCLRLPVSGIAALYHHRVWLPYCYSFYSSSYYYYYVLPTFSFEKFQWAAKAQGLAPIAQGLFLSDTRVKSGFHIFKWSEAKLKRRKNVSQNTKIRGNPSLCTCQKFAGLFTRCLRLFFALQGQKGLSSHRDLALSPRSSLQGKLASLDLDLLIADILSYLVSPFLAEAFVCVFDTSALNTSVSVLLKMKARNTGIMWGETQCTHSAWHDKNSWHFWAFASLKP